MQSMQLCSPCRQCSLCSYAVYGGGNYVSGSRSKATANGIAQEAGNRETAGADAAAAAVAEVAEVAAAAAAAAAVVPTNQAAMQPCSTYT